MATTRDSLDTLLATLKTEFGKPGRSLLPLLGVMSRFPYYSLSNQLLILAQRLDASRVMGFRAWQKAGYAVRKGETGIAIYAPTKARAKSADHAVRRNPVTQLASDSVDNSRDSEARDTDEDASPRLAYRIVHVFDLRQVEPLPGTLEIAAPASAEASETATSHAPLTRPVDAETIRRGLPLPRDPHVASNLCHAKWRPFAQDRHCRRRPGYTDGGRITVHDALAH